MTKAIEQLEKRCAAIKQRIAELGPVHPGRITKQYNVCGTPGCRCKDPEKPRKHGPYHYLSYTFEGKGKTVFVPKEGVAEMQRRTRCFVRMKELVAKLTDASVKLAKEQVLKKRPSK